MTLKTLHGRMLEIASGESGLPIDKVHEYRVSFKKAGYELPELDTSKIPARPPKRHPNRQGKRCTSCRKPSLFKKAKSFASAALRFLDDGIKMTSQDEQSRRLKICDSCPLYYNGECNACGCIIGLKVLSRVESCPVQKWFPEIRERRSIAGQPKHLLMHLLPISHNEKWKWNLRQIAKRFELFDGVKSLSIGIANGQRHSGRNITTVSQEEVMSYCKELGLSWDNVKVTHNQSKLGEVAVFPWLLSTVKDQPGVSFYCHGKGVTHDGDLNAPTIKWGDWMYRGCLDHWEITQDALELFSIAGCFRKFGQFRIRGNNRWHYSGTFYWFRNDDTFSRDWSNVDQRYYGTEAWVGKHFKAEESACLLMENAGSLYDAPTWDRMKPELNNWLEARR